jgi:hypothetical protein
VDIESIKQDFPILKQRVNDEPLTYLDSAATAQMPTPVLKAIEHYYQHDHANVHRGTHTLAQRAEGSRQAIQRDELNKSAVQDRKDKLAALSQRLVSITEKRHMLSTHMDFYRRGILKGNPTASSSRFAEALKELREIADRKNPDEHDAN